MSLLLPTTSITLRFDISVVLKHPSTPYKTSHCTSPQVLIDAKLYIWYLPILLRIISIHWRDIAVLDVLKIQDQTVQVKLTFLELGIASTDPNEYKNTLYVLNTITNIADGNDRCIVIDGKEYMIEISDWYEHLLDGSWVRDSVSFL